MAVRNDAGYAMAVLMVGLAIMAIMLSVAMPVWHQAMQREKEEELVFRGTEYARAVGLYQRRFGAGYPPSVDFLVKQKFLRKKYKDPMVADGEFQLLPPGAVAQAGQATGASQSGRSMSGRSGQSSSFQRSGTDFSGGRGNVIGGFIGVVSKSTDKSIRVYNGRDHYNEWIFAYSTTAGRGGTPGRGTRPAGPGGPGRGGRGFGPGGY